MDFYDQWVEDTSIEVTGEDTWTIHGPDGDARAELLRSEDSRAVVVIPFYEVDSVFGRPSVRVSDRSPRQRTAAAWGCHLAARGFDVLAVGWWAETGKRGGLDERYGEPARKRLEAGRGPGLARSVQDVKLALDTYLQLGRSDDVCAFGHSLGAKHALAWASVDPRPQRLALSEPGFTPDRSNWGEAWYFAGSDTTVTNLLEAAGNRRWLLIGGEDSDDEMSLRAAAATLGSGCEWMLHNGGHTPPRHVLAAAYDWLSEDGSPSRG